MSEPRKRVVITGMGAVTPLGNGVEALWDGLVHGRSGIGPITKFDPSSCLCQIAGEVKGIDYEQHFDKKDVPKLEDYSKFALIAARQATAQSGILESGLSLDSIGCMMGIGIGGIGFLWDQIKALHEKGPRYVSPLIIPKIFPNIAPARMTIEFGVRGPSLAVASACASGSHAIGEAAELIRRGDAVAMLAGGAEGAIFEVSISGFGNMHALATNFNDRPLEASRPFDAARSGFVMGEGSGVLVLEDYEHARARGAPLLGELRGYGLTSDAFHFTLPKPDGEGGARAMSMALRRAAIAPSAVQYVNAHGTSTPPNDKAETTAIKEVFGEHAHRLAISSNKSMIGHLLGAAGAVEAIATALTLTHGLIPPTVNYTTPDPDCDLDYVPNVARRAPVDIAISNSFGFGGHNCTLVLSRVE